MQGLTIMEYIRVFVSQINGKTEKMKEDLMTFCIMVFFNIYILLYCGGHFTYIIFDWTLATQVTNVTCDTNGRIQSLCQNESNATNYDYCGNFTAAIWGNELIFIGGIFCSFMWVCFNFFLIVNQMRSNKTIKKINSEIAVLQRELTEKKQEITNLQTQLGNRRNQRRVARLDNSLPPYTEQEDERGHLLTVNRLPDYQSV